jgi:hypothetical protein
LRLILSGDSAGAVAAIKEVGDATEATDAKTKAANETQAKSVSAMGALTNTAIVAGGALAGLTAIMGLSLDSYAKWGEAVIKGAALTGMSTEAYSKVAGEMKAYNVNADAATTSMKFFEKQTYAAEQGTAASVKAFTQLGISMQQVKTMSPADLLELVRSRLASCGNAAERTALMVQLFGRGSTNMILWAQASSDQMAKVDAGLKSTGMILDQQHAKQLKQAGEDWMKFKLVLQGLEITLAQVILPAVDKLTEGVTWLMGAVRPFLPLIPILAGALAAYLAVVLPIIAAQKLWALGVTALKTAQALWLIVQTACAIATGKVTLAEGLQILSTKTLTVAKEAETTATEAETVATSEGSAAMLASVGIYALVAAAIAADIVLIYKAVQAYEQMKQAMQQAAQAQAQFKQNAAAAEQSTSAKYGANSSQEQSVAKVANATTNSAGVSYTSGARGSWWNPFGWAGGFEGTVNGPTVALLGEAGKEDVTVRPVGQDAASGSATGGGGSPTVQIVVQNVFGTINRQIAQQWVEPLAQALGERLYDTQHGAKH